MTIDTTLALKSSAAKCISLDSFRDGSKDATISVPSWRVDQPCVQLAAEVPLPAGWYEVSLDIESIERHQVRKRLEMIWDAEEKSAKPIHRESFSWNRSCTERFVIRVNRPTARVRLELRHAEGEVQFKTLSIRAVDRGEITRRAVAEKIRLTLAYNCFGAALRRGGKLLLRGQFREFKNKLIKGLSDSRAMQLGAVTLSEVNHAWWRRHSLTNEVTIRIQGLVDAMLEPPAFSVILPVNMKELDPARMSAHAVRRQIYPHWHMYLVAEVEPDQEAHLQMILGRDPRVTIVCTGKGTNPDVSLVQALSLVETEDTLLMPPGVELAEHAFYELAAAKKQQTTPAPIGCRYAKSFRSNEDPSEKAVWLLPTKQLADQLPSLADLERFASHAGGSEGTILPPVLAYPLDFQTLLGRAGIGDTKQVRGKPFWFAADLRGMGGYDHVTYAMLKGLTSAGINLQRHPVALLRPDLVPPSMMPPVTNRHSTDPQLIVGPPFLVERFGIDRQSAIYTMWETDELEPSWVEKLNHAGLVIVPSAWQKQAFQANGIKVPIEVAPLGFDPLVYHPRETWPSVCTFGTAGALAAGGLRKNAQWVIDCFRKAFPTETDVRLRVKISPGSPGIETYDDPRIDLLRAVLPYAELAEWYRSLTAYVNGSFGEGFGLHLIEAMACGRPLITTHFSGLTEFFNPSLGFAVDYKLVEARNEIYRGRWAEPSEASILASMRDVYTHQALARSKGDASAAHAKAFTWKAGGKQLLRILRQYGFLQEGSLDENCNRVAHLS